MRAASSSVRFCTGSVENIARGRRSRLVFRSSSFWRSAPMRSSSSVATNRQNLMKNLFCSNAGKPGNEFVPFVLFCTCKSTSLSSPRIPSAFLRAKVRAERDVFHHHRRSVGSMCVFAVRTTSRLSLSSLVLTFAVREHYCDHWYLDRRVMIIASSIVLILPMCFSKTIKFLQIPR